MLRRHKTVTYKCLTMVYLYPSLKVFTTDIYLKQVGTKKYLWSLSSTQWVSRETDMSVYKSGFKWSLKGKDLLETLIINVPNYVSSKRN